eukprot:NODE_744_length_1208_cov_193.875755_g597_i0.p3 GENE.NODE_744_length_1208_cov_193.875755_g597_i0~~NODE_744_length_1208_cov_193.875755_g597_i0.p3  ORF type:complete len:114 (+),score=2.20 NODE_744_length_1208_cov_193.875755_g597_i0:714-1055(+)
MFLLLNNYYHITRKSTGDLISFTRKSNFLSVNHSLLNIHFQYFAILVYFVALASLALVFLVDDLASTFAVATSTLHLLNHSRTNLTQLNSNTSSLTITARFLTVYFTTTSLTI